LFGLSTVTALGEMSELDLGQTPVGVDGCGIPVHALPLRNLAHTMAKFASPEKLGRRRCEAAERLFAAMVANRGWSGEAGASTRVRWSRAARDSQ
jgi:L-asparaginase II